MNVKPMHFSGRVFGIQLQRNNSHTEIYVLTEELVARNTKFPPKRVLKAIIFAFCFGTPVFHFLSFLFSSAANSGRFSGVDEDGLRSGSCLLCNDGNAGTFCK